jgi:hypothetical protein
VMDAFCDIAAHRPADLPTARMAMAPLGRRIRDDAAEVLAAIHDDPAAPSLEQRYLASLSELNSSAAAFMSVDLESKKVPDPADEYAGEYHAICAVTEALLAAAPAARPTWRLVKSSFAAAKARPPERRRPKKPPADDREYYM